jgi:hypothetical protein
MLAWWLGRPWRVAGTGAVTLAVLALPTVGGASGARATATVLATYGTAGTYTWKVPSGVSKVTFEVFGASGGNVANGSVLLAVGGPGGEARGQLFVKPGQTFEIVVGGRGGDSHDQLGGRVGSNGGGQGGDNADPVLPGGGGGGGASDVRVGGLGNPCATSKSCQRPDRIIVGGGGGGGGAEQSGGGAGGGASGESIRLGDSGGGQEYLWVDLNGLFNCPVPLTVVGCFGQGGFSKIVPGGGVAGGGGGGGGGWYGGDADQGWGLGGAGGSGVVSRVFRHPAFPGGARVGDGLVVISTP